MDEAYLLIGPEIRNFEETAVYALRIKDEVFKQERIAWERIAYLFPDSFIFQIFKTLLSQNYFLPS